MQPCGERLPGWELRVLCGGFADRLQLVEVDRLEQGLAGGEMPVERADPDPGAAGDVLQRRVGAVFRES